MILLVKYWFDLILCQTLISIPHGDHSFVVNCELNLLNTTGMSQEIVDESNYGFVNIIAKYINENTDNIHENVKNEYGLIAENNPVALYNNNRLYKS